MDQRTSKATFGQRSYRRALVFSALILLMAQTFAQLHDHEPQVESPCAVCALSSDSVLPHAGGVELLGEGVLAFLPSRPALLPIVVRSHRPQPRAPPTA